MKINIKLDTRSTKAAIRNVREYQQRLDKACRQYVEELANVGIRTAKVYEGEYSGYILYAKQISTNTHNGARCIMIASGKKVERTWKKGGDFERRMVDALLMAEFGSGWLADNDNQWGVAGVGQGTFPEQIHATDPDGWWWEDESGVVHHSIGEAPSYPMYNAYMEMSQQLMTIGKKVFGEVLKHG